MREQARRGVPRGPLAMAAVALVLIAVFFTTKSIVARDAIHTLLPLLSAIVILVTTLRHRPLYSTPWFLLSVACLFSAAGNAVYLYYEGVLDRPPPFPSAADPFFLAFTVTPALALARLTRAETRDANLLIDSLVAGIAAGLIAWASLIEPYLELPGLSLSQTALGVMYGIGLMFVTTVLMRALVVVRSPSAAVRGIELGLGSYAVGFFGYSLLSLRGTYYTGHPVDALFLAGAGAFGIATLLDRSDATAHTRETRRLSVPTAAVYLVSMMMGPVALALDPTGHGPIENVVLLGGTALVALLILARLRGLMSEAERENAARLAATEALAESERRYRDVVEGVPGVVYRAEPGAGGRWLFVSPQIEELTGHSPAEFETDAALWFELIHPEDRDRVISAEEEAAGTKQELDIVYRLVRPDGDERWVRDRAAWTDDSPPTLQGVILDVTDIERGEERRRELEGRLRQAERLETVGRLAGGIAHDFNNTLAVILGCGRFVLDQMAAGDPRRQDAEEVIRAADQAARLTRQLLLFARAEEPTLETLDLSDIISGLRSMFARTIREDIELRFELGPRALPVEADRSQLEQVLLNLVVNARDAMPTGGTLAIETTTEELPAANPDLGLPGGAYASVRVSDDGIGIPDDVRDRIFDPFFSTKEPGEGTGLGLATAYGIVSNLGGAIAVETAPGIGTTFIVYLPLTDAAVAVDARAREGGVSEGEGTEARRDGALRILLVEDHPEVRSAVVRVLQELQHEVVAVSRGDEALDRLRGSQQAFDLLLTDVRMPGMSGPDLADQARLPTVFMSGYAARMLEDVVHPGRAFVEKPFTSEQLAAAIRVALSEDPAGGTAPPA